MKLCANGTSLTSLGAKLHSQGYATENTISWTHHLSFSRAEDVKFQAGGFIHVEVVFQLSWPQAIFSWEKEPKEMQAIHNKRFAFLPSSSCIHLTLLLATYKETDYSPLITLLNSSIQKRCSRKHNDVAENSENCACNKPVEVQLSHSSQIWSRESGDKICLGLMNNFK